MHIPKQDTTGIEVLPFDEALAAAETPRPDYDIARWLYVPPAYDEYRYVLGTRGLRPLICVGINPSTAVPDRLDPTLKSAQRIALANGYDSFLMYNVYAQRATRPDDMEKTPNEWLMDQNRQAFDYLLSLGASGGEPPAVWAAWGSLIEKRSYLPACVGELLRLADRWGAIWYHAGPLSKAGHPHHPLYLRADTPLELFDTETYLMRLVTARV